MKTSLFATLKFKGKEEPLPEPFKNIDEDKLEKAIGSLGFEFGDLEDMPEDPKVLSWENWNRKWRGWKKRT